MIKNFLVDFKAVVFDMDGVITNTMPYHFDAWAKVFNSIGIKVDCYDVYKREGQRGLTTLKEIFSQRSRPFHLKQAKQLLREKEELFKRSVKIKFIKGARPFLRKLKKYKFKLGLVTGTSRHEMEKILPESLRGLFDVTITGCEVKRGKPHPEPFERAVNMLGMPKQQVIVIENAPFGIASAKAAGLRCIALETSLPRKYLKQADIVFGSFKELEKQAGVYGR
ncbi:MAG: HAD family phosphatase [Candidatus Omnitrophota bacterium]